MKTLLLLLLTLCLLLTACVTVEPRANDTGELGAQGGATTARAVGAATSTATGDTDELLQDEVEEDEEPFTLYPAYLQVPLGQHVTLCADAAPAGKRLVWSSSDTAIAAVDDNGRITPINEGEAVITAALADDAGISSTCGVLVAAEGNIFLWEYAPEPLEIEALMAEREALAEEEEKAE